MATAVEENVDSELTVLVENHEEVPCSGCSDPATHSANLGCDHSFLLCDNHTRRVRIIAATKQTARCSVCYQDVGLKSLNPI